MSCYPGALRPIAMCVLIRTHLARMRLLASGGFNWSTHCRRVRYWMVRDAQAAKSAGQSQPTFINTTFPRAETSEVSYATSLATDCWMPMTIPTLFPGAAFLTRLRCFAYKLMLCVGRQTQPDCRKRPVSVPSPPRATIGTLRIPTKWPVPRTETIRCNRRPGPGRFCRPVSDRR